MSYYYITNIKENPFIVKRIYITSNSNVETIFYSIIQANTTMLTIDDYGIFFLRVTCINDDMRLFLRL